MVFCYGDREWNSDVLIRDELLGKPKGIKRVLQERGLWHEGLKKQCARKKKNTAIGSVSGLARDFEEREFHEVIEEYETRTADRCEIGKDCCALRILEAQPDFANEISLLGRVVREAGHEVIFYPKFHCEFNYIEYFWATVKRYTRENCSYSFQELESTVLAGLDSVSLETIRRFAMKSKR